MLKFGNTEELLQTSLFEEKKEQEVTHEKLTPK